MKKIPSQTEKKMIYGIRSLKNGTGSVLIGASIVLLSAAMPTISANENLPQTQENTSAVIKAPTETETSQTQKETPISEQKNANASLDAKKEALAAETPKKEDATTSQPNSKEEKVDTSTSTPSSDQKPQADTSSEEPIEDNYFRIHVKNSLKKTRILKVFGHGTMLKNLLKTGQMEPSLSRMPSKMTTAIISMSNSKMSKPRRSASSSTILKGIT